MTLGAVPVKNRLNHRGVIEDTGVEETVGPIFHRLGPPRGENRDIRLIAASNLARVDRDFDYVINYSALIDEAAEFPDNSMCMLIRLLIRCGCKEAVLAGFDGYTPDNVNYFDVDKAYSFLTEKADSLNDYARRFFRETADRITVTFLTPTEYRKGSEQ